MDCESRSGDACMHMCEGRGVHVLSCGNMDKVCRSMKWGGGCACVGRVGSALKGWGAALLGRRRSLCEHHVGKG